MKIFRKLRQKLLSENAPNGTANKLSKYLIYAIGEIVLVVIGILIAVAINNNQQRNILERKEQTYLRGLQNEFETSKSKLTQLIKVNQENYTNAEKILEHTNQAESALSEKEFSNLLFNSFAFDISFNANNSLLNEMINSGSLKDISNDGLRILLTNWGATMEDIARQEFELGEQRVKVLDMFRTDRYSIRTIFAQTNADNGLTLNEQDATVSNLSLLQSLAFENNVLMFHSTSLSTEKTHYLPLMQELDAILNLLKNEIDEE
ncbi:hypothetical protein D1013_05695 [Euzebyella marina]|uniref:Uncharacterized protein n=1 Tax=Euzebyella marina TaxID=1761453 RepID=A0A3G2L3N8_9FLAO|nr:DUF6090 family protein [Euzebyella marina]AYN66900.1 hypothetical protein D1013_05695 [Euzebyella marina]